MTPKLNRSVKHGRCSMLATSRRTRRPWRSGAKQRKIAVDAMCRPRHAGSGAGKALGNQSQRPRNKIMMMTAAKAPMMKAVASRIGREKRRAAAFPSCASRWLATFSQAVAINSWARLSSGVVSFAASSRQSSANFRYSATVFTASPRGTM
jgi:hypothetical protein